MSSNLENDRSLTTSKMYPIDLAPQKITIVKNLPSNEVKMAHLIPGQPKATVPGQIITHTGPVGLMRPAAQILSPGVSSQTQMIVSGSPILQGAQIVSQGTQLIGQGSQIITQSQLISPSGQIISPGTQIISQGTQLSAQVSSSNNAGSSIHVSVPSSVSGAQVLSVGGLVSGTQGLVSGTQGLVSGTQGLVSGSQGLVSGASNLVVSSSVRTLPPSVRVLPPLPHHNTRPVLSSVNVSPAGGVLVSKGVTSHVPRGLAAGASLAVRPVAPASSLSANQGGAWSSAARGRGALVYGARTPLPRAAPPPPAPPPPPRPLSAPLAPCAPPAPLAPQPTIPLVTPQAPLSAIVTLPSTTVLTSTGVITGTVRASTPRPPTPTTAPAPPLPPRPLPLLQRNYQPKVVGVASVGVRGVGNSAPAQLYYEVPRAHAHAVPRPAAPYAHALPAQVSVVNAVQTIAETRPLQTSIAVPTSAVLPRPTILRKRDIEGSPTKSVAVGPERYMRSEGTCAGGAGWEDVPVGGAERREGSGGSTTMSASSSPAPDDELDRPRLDDLSPRKKPRKQMLSIEVRQCQEFQAEEAPPTPPAPVNPPPKRPLLSSSYVCGWRGTALHFTRPADVRRREPRAKDILAIASQKHVLTSAEGWKVHHLTAQMDDLVSLEADVGSQLAGVLRALEGAGGRALAALQPHSHALLELIKGNIQRSKIVCEGIQEARDDILRVFTHRTIVSEILARQADKRCFRKHRSQS